MPSKRYALPPMGDLLNSVVAPQQQQQPVARMVPPQNAFQGLVSGILSGQRKQQQEAMETNERSREVALRLLDSIPDSEENTPLKMRAAADILSAKPSEKNWWNRLVNPEPDLDMKAQMMSKVMGLIPQPGQEPQSGQANFGDTEDGNFQFDPEVYVNAEGKRFKSILNKKTGETSLQEIGDLKPLKQVIAETKNNGTQLSLEDKKIQARAKLIAAKAGTAWETLGDEDRNAFLMEARKEAAAVLKAEDESKILTPQLKQSTIEMQNNRAPGTYVDPASGLTPAQEVTRNDRRGNEARQLNQTFGNLKAEYLRAWEQRKAIESNPLIKNKTTGEIDPVVMSRKEREDYDRIKAQIVELEAKLNSTAQSIETDYGDLYGVKYNQYNLPEALVPKASARGVQGQPKTPQGIKQGPSKVRQVGLDAIPGLLNIEMPSGMSQYYISDGHKMNAVIGKHPNFPAGEGVYVVDLTRLEGMDAVAVGSKIQLPKLDGLFEVVFNSGTKVTVKKVQ